MLRSKVNAIVNESPADTPLEFQVALKCKNGDAAKSMNTILTGAVRDGRRTAPPEAAEMLDELKIEVNETRVLTRVLVRRALLIEPLRAAKWNRPDFQVANLT